jgi:hypothetical protein
MARSWTIGLSHLLGPAHAGAFHAIFNQVLAGAFHRATGNRPTEGEALIIAHAGAVAIEVVGDRVQRFAFGTGQAALSSALTDALDDLADLAEENSQGSVEEVLL